MLTYCTNIHPGESWAEIFENLRRYVPAVKQAVSPADPFPIGLRLSARAAEEIDPLAADQFEGWCREGGCFVATINGFPYGRFHGAPVKEEVYLPDWRHGERLRYTQRLADLLARWLPPGREGSISTVPVGFRGHLGAGDFSGVSLNVRAALEKLDDVAQATGKKIVLALEPEPGCLVETTEEAVRLVAQLELPGHLARYLGVCFDCCHQAVQFEDPRASLALLEDAGIPVGHVQVSSALQLRGDLRCLERFGEPCYLHQTVGRRGDGTLVRYDDLPLALAAGEANVEEWRVHFHVPVFVERIRECETTQSFLEEILPLFAPGTPLEVETYTWAVLPPDLQTGTVIESIAREIDWVRRHR